VCEAPHEVLEKLQQKMIMAAVAIDPKTARETWGMLPEHQAIAMKPTPPPRPGGKNSG